MSLELPAGNDLSRILMLGHFSIDSYYGTPTSDGNGNLRGTISRPVNGWEVIYSTEAISGINDNQIFPVSNSSFQGTAYRNLVSGEIVVAFRGTDEGTSELGAVSIPMGAGISENTTGFEFASTESHVRDAYNFLAGVYELDGVNKSDITLTGHSLGGILAGALGAITNIDAVTFDSGPHNLAVDYFRDDLDLTATDAALEVDYSVVENFRVTGEILQASIDAALTAASAAEVWSLVSGNLYAFAAVNALQARFGDAARMGDIYEELSAGDLFAESLISLRDGIGASDATNLHMMPMLQLLLYGQQELQLSSFNDVTSFLRGFYDNELAQRAGYSGTSASQLLFEDVVLSLMDDSEDVLTDTLQIAEDILFLGMDADFGDLETWEFVIPDFQGPVGRMSEILVELAGEAARNNTSLPSNLAASLFDGDYISINLQPFGQPSSFSLVDSTYGILQLFYDLEGHLTDGSLSPLGHYFANADRLTVYAEDANNISYITEFNSSEIVIGGAGGESISTSNGNDVIFGNAGDDIILAGPGDDLIIGTDAAGFASDDIIYGGPGFDIAVYDELSTSWSISEEDGVYTIDEIGAAFGSSTTDTLHNVELLRFSDGYYYTDTDQYLSSDRVTFVEDAIFIDGVQVNAVAVNGVSLLSGLGGDADFGENVLPRNDDGSSTAIDITDIFGVSGLNFYGREFTELWVNNNGSVTFNGPRSTFTPNPITQNSDNPEITPFFADVDTRGGAGVATPGGTSQGTNNVYWHKDTAGDRFIVTWDDVGYYSSHTDKLNAFQLILTDAGSGDFDIEFRYEDINWTTGDASGGSDGLGGTVARAGFTAGTGNSNAYFELPGSGDENAILSLEDRDGFSFTVRSGNISSSDIPALPDFTLSGWSVGDPHLSTLDGLGYDFHAAGEFVLLRSTGTTPFEAQARFTPVADNATITEAVAFNFGSGAIMFDANDPIPLTIDGVATEVNDLGSLTVGDDQIFRSGGQYTIVLAGDDNVINDGDSQITVTVLDERIDVAFNLENSFAGNLEGLLGDGDGNQANDIARANGQLLERPLIFDELYGGYRNDWRVSTEQQSLFTYDGGESLGGFYLPDHPNAIVSLDTLTEEQRTEAETLAEQAGLTPGTSSFNNAVLDYALTQDSSFFQSSLSVEAVAIENVVSVVNTPTEPVTPDPTPEPEPTPTPEPDPEPANRAPTAVDDEIMGRSGWLLHGNLYEDNGNGHDFDSDGDAFDLIEINSAAVSFDSIIELDSGAQVVVQENGDFVFDQRTSHTPETNNSEPDATFTYTIVDGDGDQSTGTVEIELGDSPESTEVSMLEALYQIAFDRPSDASGLAFWEGIREQGMSIDEIADYFAKSEEFAGEDGATPETTAFLIEVYENAFDRLPDQEGFNFWAGNLDDGNIDHGDVIEFFALSNEMHDLYLADGFMFV